ncbi:DNA (cytosine-5-)-methyltransferase [Parafrigoribacterium soli]|uniref:DNA (cytosine-5-)-methyltransferase n=1 Tax=Parafrigoribacterium soli TaxID=3144663 RepID=UPI0032EFAD49
MSGTAEVRDSFKFIDLFAGLGGFHVALSRLGGKAVFAAEWVDSLANLYEQNFSLRPQGDISKIDPKSIPDHDVLTAGFPCQPFSKAGEQLGFEHTEQGQLFFHVVDILREKRPHYFILENVPNILKHKSGATIARIEAELRDLGYDVQINRFSPHHFGIPQVRDRVYIVGSSTNLDAFQWPKHGKQPTDVRSVLEENPTDARQLSQKALDCLQVWDDFLTSSPAALQIPSFPIWSMEFGATYPFEDETPFALTEELGREGLAEYRGSYGARLEGLTVQEQMSALPSHARRPQLQFPQWKVDFIRQNREFYAANKKWIDPWLPKVVSFPSSFQKFEWNAKGETKSVWNLVVQMRASGVRVKRPTTAPSLVAMTDTQVPIIAWERRYMTPRECSALQSLESIDLPVRRTDAYRALGNAVNARVVEQVASALLSSEQAPVSLGLKEVEADAA